MSIDAGFSDDFLDMLRALDAATVDYVVVGAHALAAHGVPRATGDLDILIRASPQNALNVLKALRAFGARLDKRAAGRDKDLLDVKLLEPK